MKGFTQTRIEAGGHVFRVDARNARDGASARFFVLERMSVTEGVGRYISWGEFLMAEFGAVCG